MTCCPARLRCSKCRQARVKICHMKEKSCVFYKQVVESQPFCVRHACADRCQCVSSQLEMPTRRTTPLPSALSRNFRTYNKWTQRVHRLISAKDLGPKRNNRCMVFKPEFLNSEVSGPLGWKLADPGWTWPAAGWVSHQGAVGIRGTGAWGLLVL